MLQPTSQPPDSRSTAPSQPGAAPDAPTRGTYDRPRPRTGKGAPSWLFWGAILLVYLYPTFMFPIHNPNERVRIYMTAAMVEHGTFAIGYREMARSGRSFTDYGSVTERWGYVNDKALACHDPDREPPLCEGTLYSAKAPGTSYLGYPFYWVLHQAASVLDSEVTMDAAIFYLRLFVVVLPTLLMLLLLRRYARANRMDPVLSDLVVAGVGLGSMVLTYSHMFAGHGIATVLLFFAYYASWRSRQSASPAWPLLAGLASGLAVCTEYPFALVVLPLFAYQAVVRPKLSTWLLYGVGALPGAALAALFHAAAFGSPFSTPYTTLENPQFVKDIAPGVMGLRAPRLQNLFDAFLAPYEGLFYFAPWHVLAFIVPLACLFTARRPDVPASLLKDNRRSLLTALAALAALTLFIACHSLWRGGWTLGPRYIVPFVPFAALALLHGTVARGSGFVRNTTRITAVLVSVSIIVTGACSLVSQGFHTAFFNPLREVVWPLLAEGFVTVNAGNAAGLEGLASAAPVILAAAALCLWFFHGADPVRNALPRRAFNVSLSILASSVLVWGLTMPRHSKPSAAIAKAYAFTRDNFYLFGVSGPGARRHEQTRDQTRAFPGLAPTYARRMRALTADAQCRDALNLFRQTRTAQHARTTSTAVSSIISLSLPFPAAIPIPQLASPPFDYVERR